MKTCHTVSGYPHCWYCCTDAYLEHLTAMLQQAHCKKSCIWCSRAQACVNQNPTVSAGNALSGSFWFARLALSVCFCLDPRIAYIVTSNRQVFLLPNVCLKLIDCSLKIRQCNQATVWSCRTTRIKGTSNNNKWHMEALRPCSALQCTWIIWICWIKTDGEAPEGLCGTPNLWSHAHLSYLQLYTLNSWKANSWFNKILSQLQGQAEVAKWNKNPETPYCSSPGLVALSIRTLFGYHQVIHLGS